MANVKTAISIRKSLFEKADALARRLKVSRSQLFSLAVEQFIREHENRELLEQIDRVFAEKPDTSEINALERLRTLYWELLEPEEWN